MIGALKRLFQKLARAGRKEDPWQRFSRRMPVRQFGRGSWHPFPWYFEGESRVQVASVDDVCDWLLGCTYVSDDELFHESDYWQHPSTFERIRQGDCEDYALWAWRKLVELGLEAELMSGIWQPPGDTAEGHVWVRFRHQGRDFILETVTNSRSTMVRPVDEVRSEYVPHAGVDERFLQHAYYGYFHAPG